jgi:GlpG protein
MRLIGHLPTEPSATRFGDLLYAEGIGNQIERDAEGLAVWIHAEEQIESAKVLLARFLQNPNEPGIEKRLRAAREMRQRAREQEAASEKPVHDRARLFRTGFGGGARWFTSLLIALSLAVTIWVQLDGPAARDWLLISVQGGRDLPEVRAGQVWRLITPIFLHGGIWHLLFNMMCLFDLGGMIETHQGSRRLLWLVLIIGLASNLGQYFVAGPRFLGMSGVVYGLLGYAWIRGKFDPASGLFLHPQTVAIMLAWFFLCFTPLLPSLAGVKIANTTHAVGLIVGLAWGFVSALLANRRR